MLKTMPRPLRAATNGMRPVKISQIANKIMPTPWVILMMFIFFYFILSDNLRKCTRPLGRLPPGQLTSFCPSAATPLLRCCVAAQTFNLQQASMKRASSSRAAANSGATATTLCAAAIAWSGCCNCSARRALYHRARQWGSPSVTAA